MLICFYPKSTHDIRERHTRCLHCDRQQYASSICLHVCEARVCKPAIATCAQGAVREALRGVRAMCARPLVPQPRAARLCARAVLRVLPLAGGDVRESEPAARRVPVAARVRGARRTAARHAACAHCALRVLCLRLLCVPSRSDRREELLDVLLVLFT